ncbi:MAG: hypothetical protein NWS47_04215 [Alphaproteobacteria bacterium]|nr:hypothetical protein [Alphaproteobacteria bacterium]
MRRRNSFKLCVIFVCLGTVISAFLYWRQTTTLVLWSWQRKDDLSFVDKGVVISPLVASIFVDNKGVFVCPRGNVLKLGENAQIIPVVRLEISPDIYVDDAHIDTIIHHIKSFIVSCKADAIQIDFDATKSQRSLYEKLLVKSRSSLPQVNVSITALASWCVGDTWIDKLPITHAVPMIYNLGEHVDDFKKYFKDKKQWRSKKCQGFIGFEQSDVFIKPPRGWNVYIFNKNAWTEKDYKNVQEKLH